MSKPSIPTKIPTVSNDEFESVLKRARDEHWTDLAVAEPIASWVAERSVWSGCPEDRAFILDRPLTLACIENIASISSLTSLFLGVNSIEDEGARALASLRSLTSLYLSDSCIEDEGARALTSLRSLTSLYLSSSCIGDEGARALASLSSLTSLDLSGNSIGDEGARALGSLRSLTSLDLSGTSIGEEGVWALASLRSLTSLRLHYNRIGDEGVRALGSLRSLTSLDLNDSRIGDEGAQALASLRSLTLLNLSGNRIGDEGARALGSLRSLTFLNLSSNRVMDEGARALGSLRSLTSLDLYNNRIGDEGARALGSLSSLTSLQLDRNRIGDEGARALGSLSSLTSLHLSSNDIGDEGARALGSLSSLTSLQLDRNRIGDEGARALASLSSLTSLQLSNNRIGDKGARALGSLRSLTSLGLSNNDIGDEGARALGSLSNLTSLDFSNNNIGDEGARALALAPSLARLTLFGNHTTCFPAELLGRHERNNCLPNLRSYYAELDKGSVPNRAIKLLLIGNGCVGKTTLAYCLMHGHAPPQPIAERTHGIVRQHLPLTLADGTRVDAHLWDFGGQELYHTTHRLFFHGNAVYLLLWAEQTDEDPNEPRHPARYWLHMVQHLAPGSAVLLVKNQIDRFNTQGRPPSLEGHELGEVIPVAVSAQQYTNIDALKAALAERVDKTRYRWRYLIPTSWDAVRNTLQAWRDPATSGSADEPMRTVSVGRFRQLCVRHEIDDPGVLLRFLHETGEIFYRESCFDDSIILDQNWFIDAIYRLFDRSSGTYTIALKSRGRLLGAEAALFWPDVAEPEHRTYFEFMLRVGMAFELNRGYGKPFAQREIVVPSLLPTADDPSLRALLREWDEVAAGEWWLRLEYPFLHRGVIERIIVELSRIIEAPRWWQDGLVVSDPETDCSVLLRAAATEGYLDVRLRRGRQGAAFARVCAFLAKHHEWPPSRILISTDGSVFVDLAAVEEVHRQRTEHLPSTSNTVVGRRDYDKFLHRPKSERPLVNTMATPEPIRIFISYCRKDEAHRETLETHLKAIGRVIPIDAWHDQKVAAGDRWEDNIDEQLAVADVVILMISPDFMASDYCISKEMAAALKKYEQSRGIPIPIIVRPAPTWMHHEIGQHQALPKGAKAISKWESEDDAWEDVSEGLLTVLEQLAQKRGLLGL